ncbi:uncharacterized protein LOC127098098 [Lathyrus oleraceus]|uniref:DUF674 family protein n=1 Tax=Pisum sativum TaxID=3888 RepID=A0A9D4WHV3_PEA|nr:uncharacterized protein LOC127098097 [Pisum sativum]XP_050892556.1 uncharacterized protein LOC127098098 [Pisum sativum]KAI5401882.1 hypothetical protein KIW84_066371 [Pisum sativum]KAI5401884.1 hypothetical protein KIW84_066373 [Pisum sativum]
MASSSSTKVSMKLLIDTKNQKVLFAEASKSVVDFLFNLLCLPIGTVVKLLSANGMVGSLGNLYQSVENLNQNYMLPDQTKDILLNPRAQSSSTDISGFLTQNDANSDDDQGPKLYMCQNKCNFQVTYDNQLRCPCRPGYGYCSCTMNNEVRYVGNKNVAEKKVSTNIKSGFVKDVVTFMVMDDLVIEPMSTISSITLLNKFNVKEIGTLQEKNVEMGMDEGIKLLKASLQSKMVLTSVFIKKQK